MRERDKRLNGRLNLIDHSIGGILAVFGYEFQIASRSTEASG
jgi:hypothetical protein